MKTIFLCTTLLLGYSQPFMHAESALESGWENPPTEARLRAYWWWLNGNVTAAAITRDLEEMKAKGFGGAVLIDAGGASAGRQRQRAARPDFFHARVARALQARACAKPTGLAWR